MNEERKLQYTEIDTGKVIHEVDVTGRSERQIEKITLGMMRNMREGLYIADTADEVVPDHEQPSYYR